MKKLRMPDIEARHPARHGPRLFVPGGWEAMVAEVQIDDRALRAYTAYLGDADAAHRLHQKVYEAGYVKGLRLAIARRAQEYATKFPDLLVPWAANKTSTPFVLLRGFDPAALQSTYVPFDQPGRAGNESIDKMLLSFAQAARAEAA